jgi:hypothetical protein
MLKVFWISWGPTKHLTPSSTVPAKQPTGGKRATEEKASGGADAEVGAEVDAEANAKARAEAGEFSRKYFVRAANSLTKSIKEKCDHLISPSLNLNFFDESR